MTAEPSQPVLCTCELTVSKQTASNTACNELLPSTGCRRQLEKLSGSDLEYAINTGCVLFKEGDFEGAAARFKEAAALDASQVEQQVVMCACG